MHIAVDPVDDYFRQRPIDIFYGGGSALAVEEELGNVEDVVLADDVDTACEDCGEELVVCRCFPGEG